jgi:hypothetical protein
VLGSSMLSTSLAVLVIYRGKKDGETFYTCKKIVFRQIETGYEINI